MIEVQADLWTYPADYRCVTTNGVIMKNGELVMGGGIALDAKIRYPLLPKRLAENIKIFGNKPFIISEYKIISFPTKDDWKNNSILELIERSASDIAGFVKAGYVKDIITGRPGCGLGGLKWEDVKPVLEKYFDDDRFVICSK